MVCFGLLSPPDRAMAYRCEALEGYLAGISDVVWFNGDQVRANSAEIPKVSQDIIRYYKKQLLKFGKTVSGKTPETSTTVFVPMSGFKVNALLLFPHADVFVLVDRAIPFLAQNELSWIKRFSASELEVWFAKDDMVATTWWKGSPGTTQLRRLTHEQIQDGVGVQGVPRFLDQLALGVGEFTYGEVDVLAYHGMALDFFLGRVKAFFNHVDVHEVLVFPEWVDEGYRCHGIIRLRLGQSKEFKTIVYLQAEIEEKPLEASVTPATVDVVRRGSVEGVPVYFPNHLFSTVDAMVARGTYRLLHVDRFGPQRNSAVAPFVSSVAEKHGVVVEGWMGSTGEVFPKTLTPTVMSQHGIDEALMDPSIFYSYEKGIRALLFR